MKNFLITSILLVATGATTAALAQESAPLTRAQVRSELIQLEQAGYNPSADDSSYPTNIQSAEARVADRAGMESAYGPSPSGKVQTGVARAPSAERDIFFGQ